MSSCELREGRCSSSRVYLDSMPIMPVDPYGRKHAYAQVAEDVARRITEREIVRKLPAERALSEEYGVSYVTVRHAMKILRERGLIATIHGRGTFVLAELDRDKNPRDDEA